MPIGQYAATSRVTLRGRASEQRSRLARWPCHSLPECSAEGTTAGRENMECSVGRLTGRSTQPRHPYAPTIHATAQRSLPPCSPRVALAGVAGQDPRRGTLSLGPGQRASHPPRLANGCLEFLQRGPGPFSWGAGGPAARAPRRTEGPCDRWMVRSLSGPGDGRVTANGMRWRFTWSVRWRRAEHIGQIECWAERGRPRMAGQGARRATLSLARVARILPLTGQGPYVPSVARARAALVGCGRTAASTPSAAPTPRT